MRIVLQGKVYNPATIDRITLRHLLKLEGETAALGKPMSWRELRAMADRISNLTGAEAEADPDWPWFLGMLIWATRIEAGEDVTFGEAVDFPLGDLDFIEEPQDHREPATPRKARPGSGRAGAARPASPRGKSKKTSGKRSSPA